MYRESGVISINTVPDNMNAALSGTYHSFDFAKYHIATSLMAR